MESLFQIFLTLRSAHSTHRLRVFGPRQNVFRDRDSRFFCQFPCQDGRLVIPSFPHSLRRTGDRHQDLRGVAAAQLLQKGVQRAGHFPPVIVGVFPAALLFEPVQRARDAPVAEGRRPSVIDMPVPSAVGAVLLFRLHGLSAPAAGICAHRPGNLCAVPADQGPVWLNGSVTDRASPWKPEIHHRCR